MDIPNTDTMPYIEETELIEILGDIPDEAELYKNMDIPMEEEIWEMLKEQENKKVVPPEEPHYFYTAKRFGKLKLLRRKK
jgi:hypothetical protein